jgi:hypothetical protein
MFLFTVVLEIGDLVLDWNFYMEIKDVDLIAKEIRHCILGFAFLGSVLFLCTLINKCVTVCDDNYKEEKNRCATGLSLLSTFAEDLPQIVLALIVDSKTTILLSPVQIAKAGYGIIEPIIQIALNGRECWKLRKNVWNDNTCLKACSVVEMCVHFVIVICSSVLFGKLILHL